VRLTESSTTGYANNLGGANDMFEIYHNFSLLARSFRLVSLVLLLSFAGYEKNAAVFPSSSVALSHGGVLLFIFRFHSPPRRAKKKTTKTPRHADANRALFHFLDHFRR
jgi:hypothetical protein